MTQTKAVPAAPIVARTEAVLCQLREMGSAHNAAWRAKKFGISAHHALGVTQRDIRQFAGKLGKDSELGAALFRTGVYDARLLCARIFDHRDLNEDLMNTWAAAFDTWEICDSFCMALFVHSELAQNRIDVWSNDAAVFVKRAAFSMIAAYGPAHKQAPDKTFNQFLTTIKNSPPDDRLYVKKAVSWSLRSIGKRNISLHAAALELARQFECSAAPARRWVGANVCRELERSDLRLLNYPRAQYGAQA